MYTGFGINNLQGLICHKTQSNKKMILSANRDPTIL